MTICGSHSDCIALAELDVRSMFTGIVETVGVLEEISDSEDGVEVHLKTGSIDLSDTKIGDSLAVNGICLTVTEIETDAVRVFVSNETLSRTAFGSYREGALVNLEQPLRLNQGLGGHFVSGHIDGIGRCVELAQDGASIRLEVEVPQKLGRFIATKGSITLNGVSLTINSVVDEMESTIFSVNIIPHTLKATTLGRLSIGNQFNVEVDMIARYVERLTHFQ